PCVYQRVAPLLAEHGFTCRTLRLPGFGMPFADYRRSHAAGWREAVGNALRELRTSHQRIAVVAHSLGAAVTLDCLADHPGAGEGVVSLAPRLDVSTRRSPLLPTRVWYRLLNRLLFFTDRVEMIFPPDLRDQASLPLMREDQFIPRGIYREMFA